MTKNPSLLLIILIVFIISSSNVIYDEKCSQTPQKSKNLPFKSLSLQRSSQVVLSRPTKEIKNNKRIYINGDEQFNQLALSEDWTGDGTPRNPYIIEGYNITDSQGILIEIHETSVYFIVRNCYIDGLLNAWGGIVFYNVINGIIHNNTVKHIDSLGIGVYFSENIAIADNEIEHTNLDGIRIEACSGPIFIFNNTISSSTSAGIWVGDSSDHIIIKFNSIFKNEYAIFFSRDIETVQGGFNSIISENLIHNNTLGVFLCYSYNNTISNNFILDNHEYGVILDEACRDINIRHNNFKNNNLGALFQAKDDGTNNIFEFNFWNDLTTPDINNDSIVDVPYAIDGVSDNLDYFPLTEMNKCFFPICIDGNESFTTIAISNVWSGDGSLTNPFNIDNLNHTGDFEKIDAAFFTTLFNFKIYGINLVDIRNVDVHFRILNCSLSRGFGVGIFLSNVTNGCILNNTIMSNEFGIFLSNSKNCVILNNNLSNNLQAGIAIVHSPLNTVKNNSFQNNGLYIFGWELNQTIQFDVSENTINGKDLIFWQNINNQTVPINVGQIKLVNCSNILVENQNLSRIDSGLFATFSSNLLIQNNLFSENIDEGLWIWKCKNVTISNNIILKNKYSGIGVYFSNRTLISGNVISNNNDTGIFVYTSQMSTLSKNNISDTNWIGIDLLLSESCFISGNTLTNVADTGISIWNSSMNTILNNSVNTTGWSGIRLENSSMCIVKGNTVINSSTISIELYFSRLCNLSHNIVNNSKEHAIHLEDSDNSNLVQNHIFSPEEEGILLLSSDNCTLNENFLLECHKGITIEESKNGFLLGNIISDAGNVGIDLYSSENTLLLKNTLFKCWAGIELIDSSFSTLSGNFISNINMNGINLQNSGMSYIQCNIILNCSGSGIFLSDSGNNWVSDNMVSRGFTIVGNDLSTYKQANMENNTLENGKLIIFQQNTSGLTINKSSIISPIGQILLINCESINVFDQNFMEVSTCILIAYCRNIKIYHNILSKSEQGISLVSSWFINISYNNITKTALAGIAIKNGGNCSIIGNKIYTITGKLLSFSWREIGDAISFFGTKNNIISMNIIYNASSHGMSIKCSENTLISKNSISYCGWWGILLYDSNQSTFLENSITNNIFGGILMYWASNCSIRSNIIAYNEGYGVFLMFDTILINTVGNDFLDNNQVDQGSSQAYDDGTANIFIGNYWNDWIVPDRNRDGIVDYPYQIDGNANNNDYYPLVRSINTPLKDYLPLNIIIGVPILLLIISTISLLQMKKRK